MLVIALVIAFGFLVKAIKIVPEYQRIVVLRLGKSIDAKGPGMVCIIPYIDRPIWQDLREIFIDVPPQTCVVPMELTALLRPFLNHREETGSLRDLGDASKRPHTPPRRVSRKCTSPLARPLG